MRILADGTRLLTPEEQKQEFAKARECKFCENYEFVKSLHKPGIDEFDGSKITYRYTAAYVDEVLVNGKPRGRTTHYTWKKLNFCPVCGKKLKNKSKWIY